MIPRKIHRLKSLQVDEISLVDRPANEFALVVLAKRRDQEMTMQMVDVMKAHDATLIRVAKHVIDGDGVAFADVDFYDAVRRGGEAIRKAGETQAQARVRFMKGTEAGRTLAHAAVRTDQRPAPSQHTPGTAGKQIDDKAHALMLNEAGSRSADRINPVKRAAALARARIKVRQIHPQLAAAEASEY